MSSDGINETFLNEDRRHGTEGRSQEAVFVMGIYTPLQQFFA
ncbi:hypothetical protein [Sphaerospermopsis sp. FACHB-1194]|nr:hypothetical protein [Sphaerospermopsis sp. FACHB-1194]